MPKRAIGDAKMDPSPPAGPVCVQMPKMPSLIWLSVAHGGRRRGKLALKASTRCRWEPRRRDDSEVHA